MRAIAILIAFASLTVLSGCANTRPAAQADTKSIIQEPQSDHEIHGEVGVMYGASAR